VQVVDSRGLGAIPIAIGHRRSSELTAILVHGIGWARQILLAAARSIMPAVTSHSGKLRFGRNRRRESKMTDQVDDLDIPIKGRGTPAAVPPAASNLSRVPSESPPSSAPANPIPARPLGQIGQPPEAPLTRTDQTGRLPDNSVEAKTLIIGQGISLSGEINSCARLVVEGSVQANLQACRSMVITETGLFDENASIDDADIYGRFEGDLVVRKRLLIRANGQVSGTISYGQIEVEAGGKIAGSIQAAQ
jgi:cytoskeletal protein CcmA (bactofilin family)